MAASISGLAGERFELRIEDEDYPELLRCIVRPPKVIYGIGDVAALRPGVAVIGARKATPYGLSSAEHFAHRAASRGAVIVSGGARGCDQMAHRAALRAGAPTVVVFGSGADVVYPKNGRRLFEQVIAQGGAVISENAWGTPARPQLFPQRNRIIAGLSMLLLIAEAGLPSGTFSTADAALSQGKEVAVVPGAITSPYSKGSNRLMRQGAIPVVDDESFDDALESAFESIPLALFSGESVAGASVADFTAIEHDPLLAAINARPYSIDELAAYFAFSPGELLRRLSQFEVQGFVQRGADGRYHGCVS